MAGGTFVRMNKARPGAYINFTPAKRTDNLIGARGIVTLPVELPWGDTERPITLQVEDVSTREFTRLTGLTISESEAQPIREALKNAVTALVFRINRGGTKASAALSDDVFATAVHPGTYGNRIGVTVMPQSDGTVRVATIEGGVELDVQFIRTPGEFAQNGYI